MKKIVFILTIFCFFIPLSSEGQTSVSKTSISKSKKSKKAKKIPPILIEKPSDIVYLAPPPPSITPDTPILKLNMLDSTVSNYKGAQTVVRFQKVCDECFSIRDMQRDTLTSDSLARSVRRITLQYDVYEYDNAKWIKYKKLNESSDPKVIALQREIADKQRQLDIIKADVKIKKN